MARIFKNQFVVLIALSILISALVHFINYMAMGFDMGFLLKAENFIINFVYAFLIGGVNVGFFYYLNDNFSWEKEPKKLLFMGVSVSIVLSTLAFFVARIIHVVGIASYSFSDFLSHEHVSNYVFAMFIALIVTLIFHLFHFYKAYQEAKLKEQAYLASSQSAKFQALKNQLDPHFLFNSLNVLVALIEENPPKAAQFTTSLSKVYRYVLEQKNKDLVSLTQEIDFAKKYVELLQMRFENKVSFTIDVSADEDCYLVPLSLQLLLENAIKHNVISVDKPLKISIKKEGNRLLVSNSLQPKTQSKSLRNGIGLTNIKSRYANFTSAAISISTQNDIFEVSLPLIINKH
ncbi:MAG: sensor histidine kinase [Bacteroidota bacterium]